MQRKFITNLAFLVFVNLLIKPFWILGIDRTVQNTVGTDEYGMYFAIFNFTFLFHIILDFGINNFNNRAISRDSSRLKDYFSKLVVFKLLLSVVYIAITFLIGWWIGFHSFQFRLLGFMAFNQILLSLILFFRSNIAALQLFKTDSILSVLDRLFVIVICATLLWGGITKETFKIEWFVYAQTAGLGLAMLIAFSVTVSRVKVFMPRFDWVFIKRIALQAYPFALLGLFMAIYNRVDAVMIERMLPGSGKSESGIYAASYRLLDGVNMIPFLFTTILLPLFSKMISKHESVKNVLELAFKLMMSMSIVISGVCFFYRSEIISLLYPAATPYWSDIFGWIMLSFNAIAAIYIYGSLLTANGSLKYLNMIAFSGLALNIALNFILIPKYFAMGATIATLFTQVVVAIAHVIVAHKTMRLKGNIRLMLTLLLLIMLIMVAGNLITVYVRSTITGVALLLAAGAGLAFLLRLVDIKSITSIVLLKADDQHT